ncbi:MAG: hypothetical protein KAS11_05495 [Candidatus Aenigmarchaeota archaeon]|nr:hypothetical protein [Candidatus Aenigmarchaeota archaeon]MCK5042991.1 hypothetical protein [Candidatus Aenigmarchaeota archaeon]
MTQFKASFYKLTKDELERIEFRKRFFEKNPDAHSSNYYQTINLDRREPSSSICLKKDTLYLNSASIDDYLANNTFAIDITSQSDELLARYLLVYEEDSGKGNFQYESYKISEHISFLMSTLSDNVRLYTIDDFNEK